MAKSNSVPLGLFGSTLCAVIVRQPRQLICDDVVLTINVLQSCAELFDLTSPSSQHQHVVEVGVRQVLMVREDHHLVSSGINLQHHDKGLPLQSETK